MNRRVFHYENGTVLSRLLCQRHLGSIYLVISGVRPELWRTVTLMPQPLFSFLAVGRCHSTDLQRRGLRSLLGSRVVIGGTIRGNWRAARKVNLNKTGLFAWSLLMIISLFTGGRVAAAISGNRTIRATFVMTTDYCGQFSYPPHVNTVNGRTGPALKCTLQC